MGRTEVPPVVLVPGFQDGEAILQKLAGHLRKRGLRPHAVSPQPSSGEAPLDDLAQQLAAAIETKFGASRPIVLFGFSMGGLICRYYVQRLGGAWRTQGLVTLATPHRGTWTAYLLRDLPAVDQMRPGSDFLTALNEDLTPLRHMAFTSVWTPLDLTIFPANRSWLPVGRMLRVISPFHGTLMYDPRVLRVLAGCIENEPAAPVRSPA